MHNVWRAAIVVGQFQHSGLANLFGQGIEQHAVCAVPSVNGLQWVANNKHVGASAAYCSKQRVLQRVHVLCFVYKYVAEAPAHHFGIRGIVLHVGNNARQQIVKVDNLPFLF